MKGKGLIISALLLAFALPSIAFAKNKEVKPVKRKFDLCEAIAEQENFENYYKEFSFPIDSTQHDSITSPFGIRKNPIRKRTGGPNKKYHYGWDIGVYKKPVFAMADGVVEKGFSKTEGYFIKVTCDKPYFNTLTQKKETVRYEFLHLSKRFVKKGAHVKKGQKIAISGNSGITEGAHLDFRVSMGGGYIDPATIFPYYTYFEK